MRFKKKFSKMKIIQWLFFIIFLMIIVGYRYTISLQTDHYKSYQYLIAKYKSIQSNSASKKFVNVMISDQNKAPAKIKLAENSDQIKTLFELLYKFSSQAEIKGRVIKRNKYFSTYKVTYIYSNSINVYILFKVNPKNEIYLTEIIGKISFKEKSDCLKSL